jgi:hypothetical protein
MQVDFSKYIGAVYVILKSHEHDTFILDLAWIGQNCSL